MIDLTLDMKQYDCPFIDTTDDHPVSFTAMQWDFDNRSQQLETRMLVEAPSRSALDDGLHALADHRHMHDLELLSKREDRAQVKTAIGETHAMATVREFDGYITGPFHIEGGSETWHVGVDDGGLADDLLAELERHNDFGVEARRTYELSELFDLLRNAGPAISLLESCRNLSTVERDTLTTAVESGYFNSPRDANLASLADEFDISKTAVSKNLRRSQQKLLENVIAAMADLE
ncbi:helix-turn-helix domain-containing protein [Haladaptatus sp. DYSN1]|uniref:helix-turn-helix domain-containing protein n=1 Tax=unclassified Haladaptatus TaxID=2622732 RepID=UPI00240543A6|nr:helix-turn-helix domain-containing protein [Haladaptatus sp. DYSN1]